MNDNNSAPAPADAPTAILPQPPAAVATASGRTLTLPALESSGRFGYGYSEYDEGLAELVRKAKTTDAYAQLARCLPGMRTLGDWLARATLARLADNQPVDPQSEHTWRSRHALEAATLQRHAITKVDPARLTAGARTALVAAQRDADTKAGIDWTVVTVPASRLDEPLRRAHAKLAIDLENPVVWEWPADKRRALARRLGLLDTDGEDLSRWAINTPERFDEADLRCWRIASPRWLALADTQLETAAHVTYPIGVFLTPHRTGEGWVLSPVLSLALLLVVHELGGRIDRALNWAIVPAARVSEFLDRVSHQALHAGPKELLGSARQLGAELSARLGQHVYPGVPVDPVHRWGRLVVHRYSSEGGQGKRTRGDLQITVATVPARAFPMKRVGAQPLRTDGVGKTGSGVQVSAAMDLGEAVSAAAERGLALLLSTEAAGALDGSVRVGRMKGRPGMLTITRAVGMSASTERHVAEQALPVLRGLKSEGVETVLDAGARQLVRMTVARPLADDPILKTPQQQIAALKVVGSGVDASATATGKTVTSARALSHRAAKTPGLRALIVAEGRLIGQWGEELTHGAPARGVPPLAPNVDVATLDEASSIVAQVRHFHRRLGTRGGVLLVANSIMERYTPDLMVISWHLLLADEGHRYANPSTEAHRALKALRFGAVQDCWILTATPKGKSAENIDVLVGLAVGDQSMIRERLNTRESGDLMDDVNAARYRVNYGAHLVRLTKKEMAPYMPRVLPAKPIAIEPDPALRELLEEIRQGGRDAYRALLAALRELKNTPSTSELYKQALSKLASVQGFVLGAVAVYADASVDPETLKHSDAVLAKVVVRKGLADRAISGGGPGVPLLRGVVAETLARVAAEQQVLVFADRVRCLRQLAGTIRDHHGVDARHADGATSPQEFAELKRAFNAGEFPILCLSKIGAEGHNLQAASVICHLDLSWLPDPLEQRVGRAQRPGSRHPYVETYIPYIKGGGIEHIVKVVAPRGAEHHQLLDAPAGVAAEESTIASQLGAITAEVAEHKAADGYAGTAARLRVAAAVFGAS